MDDVKKLAKAIALANRHPNPDEYAEHVSVAFETGESPFPPPLPLEPAPEPAPQPE